MQGSYRLLRWRRRPGEHVGAGDVLFELETDHSTVEVESEHYGVFEQLVSAGHRCSVGEVIGTIENPVDESMYEVSVPDLSRSGSGIGRFFGSLLGRFKRSS